MISSTSITFHPHYLKPELTLTIIPSLPPSLSSPHLHPHYLLLTSPSLSFPHLTLTIFSSPHPHLPLTSTLHPPYHPTTFFPRSTLTTLTNLLNSLLLNVLKHVLRHRQRFRTDVDKTYWVVGEESGQRVDSSAVFEVSNQRHLKEQIWVDVHTPHPSEHCICILYFCNVTASLWPVWGTCFCPYMPECNKIAIPFYPYIHFMYSRWGQFWGNYRSRSV